LSSLKDKRIGLLGGSFNPAHEGHLHISKLALERLRLDSVWWLVSPQNPLKSVSGMASLPSRLKAAQAMAAANPEILVSDMEQDLDTRYSADTVAALKQRYPDTRFVWIMGADLLKEVHHWKKWRSLFRSIPIAIFARPPYPLRALSSRAAQRFAGAQINVTRAGALADMRSPAWVYLRTRRHWQSATNIRAQQNGIVPQHTLNKRKRP